MPSLIQITKRLDIQAIRQKLEGTSGPQFWNSLEQIAETPEFRSYVEDEFPERAMDWADPAKRRTFLKLMGASLALAGLTACTKQPPEAIVPYVKQPEEFVPGKPLFYATAMPSRGGARGILVESHLGRPTKIEGNPSHPASLGAADAVTQASLLDLYDPDRSQAVLRNGDISSWPNFAAAMIHIREIHGAKQGAGLRLLTRPITSPTLGSQIQQLLATYPMAKWHQWDPVPGVAGGQAIYRLENADVIVSLDSDFLVQGPGALRYSHEFAKKRRLLTGGAPQSMSRLYLAESTVSNTGGMADHRMRLRPAEIVALAANLAGAVGAGQAGGC